MTEQKATPCAFEPLDRLARFSWDWAESLCNPAHGCQDYHRSWSMVRLLNQGGALPNGQAFFDRELGRVAAAGGRRVLISGGADTGVLALVVSAFQKAGVHPQVIFTDRCKTPCLQNTLFAHHLGLDLTVFHGNITDLACEPVDAIVAHSFLLFFGREDRQRVLETWARHLKPGGVILTSQSLHGDENQVRIKDAGKIPAQVEALRSSAQRHGLQDAEIETLTEVAQRFWLLQLSQLPLVTEENLAAGLKKVGLEILHLEATARSRTLHGPSSLLAKDTPQSRKATLVIGHKR